MALVVTPEGRFRIGIHPIGTRFILERLTSVERSEAHPDGRIAYFTVHDNSDNSRMTIDEEDAERLETLWQAVRVGAIPVESIESYLTQVFDIDCPPPPIEIHTQA